jgi:alpha-galactosidase
MAAITIIGAGSARFSLELIRDLCMTRSLWGGSVSFMDIDRERLEIAESLARRYCRDTGADYRITATTDRRRALEGAQYVICAVKVGGFQPLEAERAIAEQQGYYRGIGDRVSDYYGGIGAYHQLRFFLELARDMEDLCPQAWLLNTANPVFEGTTLLARDTRIKVVGICHGHLGYLRLAERLGLGLEHLHAQVAGFNHCVWLTDFRYEGRDAYPLVDAWIERQAPAWWGGAEYRNAEEPWMIEDVSPGAVDTYRLYGLYPVGDTVRSASPWWHHTDLETKRRWYGAEGGFDSEIAWPKYLRSGERVLERMRRCATDESVSLLEEIPTERRQEQHIPLIESLASGKPALLELNILNRGAIPGIPDDVAVEIPAQAAGWGVQGLRLKALPARLMNHVLLPRLARMESILQAFRDHDRKSLVLLVAEDPRTRSFQQASRLVDTLLAQPWNAEADRHYR